MGEKVQILPICFSFLLKSPIVVSQEIGDGGGSRGGDYRWGMVPEPASDQRNAVPLPHLSLVLPRRVSFSHLQAKQI